MAMGPNPVPPVNISTPTKIGSKMGGEFTYPKWDPIGFDNHSHVISRQESGQTYSTYSRRMKPPLTPSAKAGSGGHGEKGAFLRVHVFSSYFFVFLFFSFSPLLFFSWYSLV